jgi:hypothetical protein
MSMLRETLIHRRAAESRPDVGCHSADEFVPALLIHAGDGERWVLPWSHFASARHWGDGNRERLTLLFSHHEVDMQGVRLASLLPEIARFHLGSLRSLPAKYEPHGHASEPFIEHLSIKAIGPPSTGKTAASG